jgi:DNA-binding response OmpR family regulator
LMNFLYQEDEEIPDLIFLDSNMPRKNGIECLREIRSSDKWKRVPVIMLSSSTYDNDIEAAFANGAHFYIMKPMLYGNLVELLKGIFSFNWAQDVPKPCKERFVFKLEIDKKA